MPYSAVRNCPTCGKPNRVPAKHLADTGRCGHCKSPLPPLGEPFEADDGSFSQLIAEATVPVLTDFWADWCGPCKMAAPEVHALAKEMAGKALILKVDTEMSPRTASQYRVQSIPNFVVFRGGKPVFQRAGLAPRAEMRRWLETAYAAG
jgi:thioredoxin 2